MDYGNEKKAVCTVGWLAQLFCKLPSSREGDPNLLWENSESERKKKKDHYRNKAKVVYREGWPLVSKGV